MPFPSFITRNLKLGVYWHWFSSSAVPSRNQIVSAFVSSYTCFLPHACDFVCIKPTQLQASRSCSRQSNVKGSLFFFFNPERISSRSSLRRHLVFPWLELGILQGSLGMWIESFPDHSVREVASGKGMGMAFKSPRNNIPYTSCGLFSARWSPKGRLLPSLAPFNLRFSRIIFFFA